MTDQKTTMRAIVYDRYGSPELREIERPDVADGEVLIRVHASSVNPVDWYTMTGRPYISRLMGAGLRKPKDSILGTDLAGRVEAVGSSVTQFRPGDEVFGAKTGAFAEYVAAAGERLVPKPADLTFEQAAAVPIAALTALQALRDKGGVQPGHRVLINGASGGVGTFAVQIAKAFGAEVTGVCSTQNVDLARSIGADDVVDYTREDFTRSGRRFDLMVDVAGSRSFRECRRVLAPNATLVVVGGPKTNRLLGPLSHMLTTRLASVGRSQKVVFFVAKIKQDDLVVLRDLVESGRVTPVIDKTYALHEIRDAFRYLGEGHARGKVVITV